MDKSVILLASSSSTSDSAEAAAVDAVDGIQFGRAKGIKDDLKKNPEMNSKWATDRPQKIFHHIHSSFVFAPRIASPYCGVFLIPSHPIPNTYTHTPSHTLIPQTHNFK